MILIYVAISLLFAGFTIPAGSLQNGNNPEAPRVPGETVHAVAAKQTRQFPQTGQFTKTRQFPRTSQFPQSTQTRPEEFRIARVQYRGGGDWYNSPTSLTNLLSFAKQEVPVSVSTRYDDVQLGSREIFNYPFLYLTGHGNIAINESEMENLRQYLLQGGFLYVDDDYGMDPYVRPLLREIFPEEPFIELPADHPIYSIVYPFPAGRPPKVHEHDGKPPQAFAVYHNGRMVLLYTYESNPADGWAYDEHANSQRIIDQALKFGVNLLTYVLMTP